MSIENYPLTPQFIDRSTIVVNPFERSIKPEQIFTYNPQLGEVAVAALAKAIKSSAR